MINLLKYLPKLHKRDKVNDSVVVYRAIINGESTPYFSTKADLYTHVQEKYSKTAFSSLSMQKIIYQSLIH